MKKIFLLDGYNLFYRCFYAVPPFTGPEGQPVNAVFWLAKILLGFSEFERPGYLAVVMDSRGENFRTKIYPEYKATRDRMPDDLRSQEALLYELFASLKIPTLAMEGYEADDIIGTLATELSKEPENDVYIVSGDKDLYQFVGENVAVYDTMKRIVARREEAIEKFGVPPERVVDYLAIVGDSSDNIPGIPGFGPKKAESLITEIGSLEAIYENLDTVSGKMRETLEASRDIAFLSKKLATIDVSVPIDFDLESAKFHTSDFFYPEAKDFFRRLGFKSLLPKEETVLSDFSTLDLEYTEILDRSSLEDLQSILKTSKRISFASFEEGGRFAGCSVGVNGVYFLLRSKALPLAAFLRDLLEFHGEILGFDCKTDIRSVLQYLSEESVLAEESQGSLF